MRIQIISRNSDISWAFGVKFGQYEHGKKPQDQDTEIETRLSRPTILRESKWVLMSKTC